MTEQIPESFPIDASAETNGEGDFIVYMAAKGVYVRVTMPLPGSPGAAEAAWAAPIIFQTIPTTIEAALAALQKRAARAAGEESP